DRWQRPPRVLAASRRVVADLRFSLGILAIPRLLLGPQRCWRPWLPAANSGKFIEIAVKSHPRLCRFDLPPCLPGQPAKHRTLMKQMRSGRTSSYLATCILGALTAVGGTRADTPWVVYEGKDGLGHGKHIVLVSGDEEYRSEEALPQLARILA